MKLGEINELVSNGIDNIGLIRNFFDNSIIISGEGENTNKKQKIDYFLKEIQIENLSGQNWVYEAEYKNLSQNKCMKNAPMKTVERCFLHLTDRYLYVFMIELKSQISDCKKLRTKVKEKFTCTMTNLSILLSGNNHFSEFKEKEIYPVGLLFYNKDCFDIKEVNKNSSDICKKFKNFKTDAINSKSNRIKIKPVILKELDIPILFYQNNDYKNQTYRTSNFFSVDFNDIINILK